jgi:hypothetical protein
LTDRLEVEARVPYVVRHDRVTTLPQREDRVTDERKLDGRDFGDLELAARFQINSGARARPILVATSGKAPHNFARYIDRTIGSLEVRRVDPGDSLDAVAVRF